MRPAAAASASLCVIALALGWTPAAAQSQPPRYIVAKPERAAAALGRDTAAKIFSDAFTPLRLQAALRSQQVHPGFACPAQPQIALAEVIPYPVKPGAASWIERIFLGCVPRSMRNFLFVMEGGRPSVTELLPGLTNTDPLLQRDAMQGATAFAAARRAKDCGRSIVIDTRIVGGPPRGGPWTERWTFDQCGKHAEVEMTFTPAARGTTWNAKPVK